MRENHIRILCSVLKTDLVFEAADGALTPFFDSIGNSPESGRTFTAKGCV